jgi:uncharacterized DUF497 family protein
MNYEWNESKALANLEKHGISFEKAVAAQVQTLQKRKSSSRRASRKKSPQKAA